MQCLAKIEKIIIATERVIFSLDEVMRKILRGCVILGGYGNAQPEDVRSWQ